MLKLDMIIKQRFLSKDPVRHHNPAVFWILIAVLVLLMGGAIKILGKSDDLTSKIPTVTPTSNIRQPKFYSVTYKGGGFSPTNLRIHAGDTVRFKNDGFFAIRVISDPQQANNHLPGFDSIGDVPQGSYFSYTFSQKGIFGYRNEKKQEEQGTIIVR